MAETVSSHQVAAFPTPVNGGALDATVVRGNDNTLRGGYVAHDADPGIHVQSSTLAARPSAGSQGRKWMTVDSFSSGGPAVRLFYDDDGNGWKELSAFEQVTLYESLSQFARMRYSSHSVNSISPTSIGAGLGGPNVVDQYQVFGFDGTSNSFLDVVAVVPSGSPVVISSTTTRGAPASRTYTNALELQVSSGNYEVGVITTSIVA